jgi:hypothetical protein
MSRCPPDTGHEACPWDHAGAPLSHVKRETRSLRARPGAAGITLRGSGMVAATIVFIRPRGIARFAGTEHIGPGLLSGNDDQLGGLPPLVALLGVALSRVVFLHGAPPSFLYVYCSHFGEKIGRNRIQKESLHKTGMQPFRPGHWFRGEASFGRPSMVAPDTPALLSVARPAAPLGS